MSSINFFAVLTSVSLVIQLLPLTVMMANKAFTHALKALFIYLILSVLVEFITFYPGLLKGGGQFIVTNIYTILEGVLIMYIYYRELKIRRRYFILLAGGIFVILSLWFMPDRKYDTVGNCLEAVIIVTLSIIYFFKVSDDLSIPKLTDHYLFWINTAFLLYFSVACLPFLFWNYIRLAGDLIHMSLWSIHLAANIIFNILMAIGVYKSRVAYKQHLNLHDQAHAL